MNLLRNHPLFGGLLVALGVIAVAGIGMALKFRSDAGGQSALVEARRAELDAIEFMRPFPSSDNAAAIEADLANTQRVLESMRTSLRGSPGSAGAIFSRPPVSRTDAFFDLARFVERNRERAAAAGVAIRPDERFGFSAYANEGPEPELIPLVHRQRAIVDFLLGVLFDARLRELASVQREPARLAGHEGRADIVEIAPQNDSSFFVVDPRVTARVAGFVDSTGFRISFTGQTGALRDFLNRLAGFELPLIVRSVEIEPLAEAPRAQTAAPAAPSLASLFGAPQATSNAAAATPPGPVPIVSQNLSRFTVTVEFIELVPVQTPSP